jgi:hypothetical protein
MEAGSASASMIRYIGTASPARAKASRCADLSVSFSAAARLWNGSCSSSASSAVHTRSESCIDSTPAGSCSRSAAATRATSPSDESITGPNLRRSRAVDAAPGFEESTTHTMLQTPSAACAIDIGANESGS